METRPKPPPFPSGQYSIVYCHPPWAYEMYARAIKKPDTHYHCVNLDSIIVAPLRREHSRKPDKMIPLIENLFDGPYLELFARTQPPG